MRRTLGLLITLSCLLVGPARADDRDPVPRAPRPADTKSRADEALAAALARAGDNRPQISLALQKAPATQQAGMRWLVQHMPERDLTTLSATYLLENCRLAYEAWDASPWKDAIDEQLFFDAVLPYASVSEAREDWRADFRKRFTPLVAGAETPGAAAAILNQKLFGAVGVKYSTKRTRADQGPLESIELGLASCTGLTVLLIDACRAVGVPARFVGTPLWSDGSGNHSWVEVWDGRWRFTGAAEPTGDELDRGWFVDRAATATRDDPQHAIYAASWRRTPIHFPMAWSPEDRSVAAVDVTDRYVTKVSPVKDGHARVRIRVTDERTGERCAAKVRLIRPLPPGEYEPVFDGVAKDERFDANDHVTVELKLGDSLRLTVSHEGRERVVTVKVERDEQLIDVAIPATTTSGR